MNTTARAKGAALASNPSLPTENARLRFAVTLAPGLLLLVSGCASEPNEFWKIIAIPRPEGWALQDIATNVQDWDRVAQKIASGLQTEGLLPMPQAAGVVPSIVSSATGSFYVSIQHESVFLRQLGRALEAEIIKRGGIVTTASRRAYVIELSVDVIRWSSRSRSHPDVPRREAVWGASIVVADRIVRAYREPFYIYDSDIQLYSNTPSPGESFAGPARPLHHTTQ